MTKEERLAEIENAYHSIEPTCDPEEFRCLNDEEHFFLFSELKSAWEREAILEETIHALKVFIKMHDNDNGDFTQLIHEALAKVKELRGEK